jgi:hypothetical protein
MPNITVDLKASTSPSKAPKPKLQSKTSDRFFKTRAVLVMIHLWRAAVTLIGAISIVSLAGWLPWSLRWRLCLGTYTIAFQSYVAFKHCTPLLWGIRSTRAWGWYSLQRAGLDLPIPRTAEARAEKDRIVRARSPWRLKMELARRLSAEVLDFLMLALAHAFLSAVVAWCLSKFSRVTYGSGHMWWLHPVGWLVALYLSHRIVLLLSADEDD